MATASKQQVVTKTNSLMLVRNLLRASFAIICNARGFCDPSDFDDKPTVFAGINIPKLDGKSAKARKLINWLEQGVFDAINKRYLKELVFGLRKSPSSSILLESYHFAFEYSAGDVQLTFNGTRNSSSGFGRGYTFDEVSKEVSTMLAKVLQTVASLRPLKTHSFMWMQLEYQEDTPNDYIPPCFDTTHVVDEDLRYDGPPRKVVFGGVRSGHHIINAKLVASQAAFMTPDIHTPASSAAPVAANSQDVSMASYESDSEDHLPAQVMPPPAQRPKTFSRKRNEDTVQVPPKVPVWQAKYNTIAKALAKQSLPISMSLADMCSRFKIDSKGSEELYQQLCTDNILTPPKSKSQSQSLSKLDTGRRVSSAAYEVDTDIDMDEEEGSVNSSTFLDSNADVNDESASQASVTSVTQRSSQASVAEMDLETVKLELESNVQYLKGLKVLLDCKAENITFDTIRSELGCGKALVTTVCKRLSEEGCLPGRGTRHGKPIDRVKTATIYSQLNDKITRVQAKLASLK